eukprot:591649-Pyramimonas_sp.AAC.1
MSASAMATTATAPSTRASRRTTSRTPRGPILPGKSSANYLARLAAGAVFEATRLAWRASRAARRCLRALQWPPL